MKPSTSVLALMALAGATPLAAQTADPADSARIHRLTPAEIEAVRATAETRTPASEVLDPGVPRDRSIHGEIGAMIGTGGARGLYGTAAIPLGDTGGAVVSFVQERWGRR